MPGRLRRGNAARRRRADGGKCVGDIVDAGDLQPDRLPVRQPFGEQMEADAVRRRFKPVDENVGAAVFQAETRLSAGAQASADGSDFRIVGIEDRPASGIDEVAEQASQLVHRLVVFGNVGQHGDGRIEQGDRTVAFVDLADDGIARSRQRAREGVVRPGKIFHHRAVDDGRAAPGAMENPGDHAGNGGFAAGPGNADPLRHGVEQFGEHSRPAHAPGADPLGRGDIGHAVLDRGGSDEDLSGPADAAAVLRMQADAAAVQIVELGRGLLPARCRVERAVGPFHPMALRL